MRLQWRSTHEQVGNMDRQLGEMGRQTAAAKQAAEAAQQSSDALIEIERPWVQVVITKISHPDPASYFVYVWPNVGNVGRTPARIIIIVFKKLLIPQSKELPPEVPPMLPPQPDYSGGIYASKDVIISPGTGIEPMPVEISTADWVAVQRRETFLYVYGYVKYVGIGNVDRETKFCEMYWVPYGASDPSEEGFRTIHHIPDSYITTT